MGDGNAGVGSGGGVVAVNAYMGGARGSGVMSSAGDVREMSVMRGVGGVCDMCMCLARGGVGGEWGIGFGFYQSWRNIGKVGYVCVLVAVVWVLFGRVGRRLGSGRVGWCYVCVL